jgi:hemoglobin
MKLLLSLALAILSSATAAIAADDPPKKAAEVAKKEAVAEANKDSAAKCPVCEKEVDAKITTIYEEKTYTFDSQDCRDKWKQQREESLYHRIGGEAAMDAAIAGFYKKVLADERINEFFEDVDMKRQARKQNQFLSAAFGGPVPWKGKDLRRAHKNMDGLKDSHFDAVAENLQATLTELKVSDDLIAEVMAIAGSVRDDVLNRKKAAEKTEEKTDTDKTKTKAAEEAK